MGEDLELWGAPTAGRRCPRKDVYENDSRLVRKLYEMLIGSADSAIFGGPFLHKYREDVKGERNSDVYHVMNTSLRHVFETQRSGTPRRGTGAGCSLHLLR